jgi:hypothetical protein
MKAKPGHSITLCESPLRSEIVGDPQVIETEIRRQSRLEVILKTRQAPGDIGPFGKALSPPFVIFWNGMELRQIEREQLHEWMGRRNDVGAFAFIKDTTPVIKLNLRKGVQGVSRFGRSQACNRTAQVGCSGLRELWFRTRCCWRTRARTVPVIELVDATH